jgi:hypothetical protein
MGAARGNDRPIAFALEQNYPNPFNPSTLIRYSLSTKTHVAVKIIDLLGREVATLVDADEPSGAHVVRWEAGSNASGIYFCRMQTPEFSETRKMLLLR